ncbi:lysozyme family protein [Terribacillus saccharophilus]|uniref:lysozyme family protein n=1 Tax=Terribacillus saccharophilus TaxID=361277 RepID=UPI0039820A55
MKKKRKRKQQSLFTAFRTVLLFGLGLFFLLFVLSVVVENDSDEQQGRRVLSGDVLAYRDTIEQELAKSGQESLAPLVLSIMMQESGGRGNDPMQSSESRCGEVGCIEDPEESVAYGIDHFLRMLEEANGEEAVAIQAYNFGRGFIGFVLENGGEFSEDLAIQFAQQQYEKVDNPEDYRCIRPESEELDACYGDIHYVEAVYSYLSAAEEAYQEK